MISLSRFTTLAVLTLAALAGTAQVPAGAPAGSNGQCNDGSYSVDAKKQGACRGHKGVKSWFAGTPATASAGAAASRTNPAPDASALPAASPAPRNAAGSSSTASNVTGTGTAAKPSAARQSPSVAAASRVAASGGGPGMVWVNTESKVYHCPGTTFYGKTKTGSYMTEVAAKSAGAHADHNKPCGN